MDTPPSRFTFRCSRFAPDPSTTQGRGARTRLRRPMTSGVRAAASRVRSLFRSDEENAAALKSKYHTPIWRLNSEVHDCAACRCVLDGLALPRAMRDRRDPGRRHHCRWCGEIFCSDCTQARALVRNGEVARVCVACAAELGRPTATRVDPFVNIAVLLSSHVTNSWPALLTSVVTEPVNLSRAGVALSALAAIDLLLPPLIWSLAAIGLVGVLKGVPDSSMVVLSCSVIGDGVMFALTLVAAHTLSVRGRALAAVAAVVAGICLLYSLLQALRRLVLSIWTLLERVESELDEDASVYRELGGGGAPRR